MPNILIPLPANIAGWADAGKKDAIDKVQSQLSLHSELRHFRREAMSNLKIYEAYQYPSSKKVGCFLMDRVLFSFKKT